MRRHVRWDRMRRPRAGLANLLSGGSGNRPGGHYDRLCEELAGLGQARRLTAVKATSQEARTWS